MNRIIFLLEEDSMKALLEGLLPRLFPDLNFLCVPHEGKSDLQKSIPRKLRAWNEPGVRFVVVQDNDRGDCHNLKSELSELCRSGNRTDALVRIACQELEAWYFGEPEAVAEAYEDPDLIASFYPARFRNPDLINQPSKQIKNLIPSFQKKSGARLMAEKLTRERNRSRSFQVFLEGVERVFINFREAEGN